MPEPKVSWGCSLFWAVMSKTIGSSKTAVSRLASARPTDTNVPAGKTTSRYSMSTLANRAVPRTAPK